MKPILTTPTLQSKVTKNVVFISAANRYYQRNVQTRIPIFKAIGFTQHFHNLSNFKLPKERKKVAARIKFNLDQVFGF